MTSRSIAIHIDYQDARRVRRRSCSHVHLLSDHIDQIQIFPCTVSLRCRQFNVVTHSLHSATLDSIWGPPFRSNHTLPIFTPIIQTCTSFFELHKNKYRWYQIKKIQTSQCKRKEKMFQLEKHPFLLVSKTALQLINSRVVFSVGLLG